MRVECRLWATRVLRTHLLPGGRGEMRPDLRRGQPIGRQRRRAASSPFVTEPTFLIGLERWVERRAQTTRRPARSVGAFPAFRCT